jgi:hypothetical protein
MQTNKQTIIGGRRGGRGRRHCLTTAFRKLGATVSGTCGLAFLLATIGPADSLDAKASYPSGAPLEQYRMANRAEEIALARTAAPASIANDADVMVLGDHGYETAVKGKNGFVCLVDRSWGAQLNDPEFWNFKVRSPTCFNPAAVRSVLPAHLERTQWVLAGCSKAKILDRSKASAAANTAPATGSFSYMMSRQGHLSDAAGHWHPHLMFYQSRATAAAWGANLPDSPVSAKEGGADDPTLFFVPVRRWSDGTADEDH